LKLLNFTCAVPTQLGNPVPVKKLVPEWYRKAETYYVAPSDNIAVEDGTQELTAGLKTCAPFLDAMVSGYAFLVPFDIYVGRDDEGNLDIKWNAPQGWEEFVSERPKESGSTMPRPAGHAPNHLVWSSRWGVKAPRGYSVLITHPLNRQDLPFTTSSGIIDSDKFFGNGNIPFFIREDFVGVIEKGTPFAQIIPIKRKKWKMINNPSLVDAYAIQGETARKKETSYKKKDWVKKVFN
jgi:hypothetical protein